jgi:hypothetical protein
MPFTLAQFTAGANYTLQTFEKTDPVDQVNFGHSALDWLVKNKQTTSFGNGSFRQPLYINNGSSAQNYYGADQVGFNERDPVKQTDFPYYNIHDGFWLDADRLLANGITIMDGGETVPSGDEKRQLVDLLKVSHTTLKNSLQEALAFEFYRDGSQSTKACPGFASIISSTPAVGVVGGIDAATSTYWRNNAVLAIPATAGLLLTEMERMYLACQLYGGSTPTYIVAGSAFIARYKLEAGNTINRRIESSGNMKGGVSLDPGVNDSYFHGVPLVWDPTLDRLDVVLGSTTLTKTAYFLNEKNIQLRAVKDNWMVDHNPERIYDRYVHYFAKTSKYSLTSNRRNSLAVLSIV